MLHDDASFKERMHEIRQMNLKDVPERKGFVAEAVKNYQAKQERRELTRKRSHGALDGAASSPAAKRVAKRSALAFATSLVTEKSAEATQHPRLPQVTPFATKIGLVMPNITRPPPLAAKLLPGAPPPPAPTGDPPAPPPLRRAPDGDASVPAACAAAGPVCNDAARFVIPPPPPGVAAAKQELPPPPEMPAAAAAGPAYNDATRFESPLNQEIPLIPPHCYPPPQTRGPPKMPPPILKREYKLEATPDADRGPPPDAATLQKNVHFRDQPDVREIEAPPPKRARQYPPGHAPPPLSKPPILQFVKGCYYKHVHYGEVKFLHIECDSEGRTICLVRVWFEERSAFEDKWVPHTDLRVWERPQGSTGSAPGGAAAQSGRPVRLTPADQTLMYHITCPSAGDEPYIREFDANLVAGKVLQATANFN